MRTVVAASTVVARIVIVAGCVFRGAPPAIADDVHDLVIRSGLIFDGSGAPPYAGEIAIDADRLTYVGPPAGVRGRESIDAHGLAIAPGFINMLSHSEESFFADGRALSDLAQGVTLEVLGEFSLGPLNPEMKRLQVERQFDFAYPVTWTTLGEYLATLERRGIGPNVASFVGASTVRTYVLGERDVQPTAHQLRAMRALVHQAMEEGALGVTTMLEYVPATFARTPELIALARESARCGGIYTAHMRNESDRIEAAVRETIEIAQASGAPAEIYHFKLSGRDNWDKLQRVTGMIDEARKEGVRVSADMYTYAASESGLDVAMPPWVQDGGLEAWIARLKDPAIRKRVIADMRDPHPRDWENVYALAGGAGGVLVLQVKSAKLKPLQGRTLADIARERGVSPEDAAIDLVVEDGSRVGVAYFDMSENNLLRQVALPWMSFGSDAEGAAPEGVFLKYNPHPRAYGNFARVLARYVRDGQRLSVQEAVRKLAALPADNLSLEDRGHLRVGAYADVVVFDPTTIQDRATFERPHQLSNGVSYVIVNGRIALREGVATGVASGRAVHGRSWTGRPGGGCRSSPQAWKWLP
jgi:N-acyl-D-amino-acid deacylase